LHKYSNEMLIYLVDLKKKITGVINKINSMRRLGFKFHRFVTMPLSLFENVFLL